MTSITPSAPAPAPTPAGPAPRAAPPARTNAREQRQQGDAFERVLRRKTEAAERGADLMGDGRVADADGDGERDVVVEGPDDGGGDHPRDDAAAAGPWPALQALASLLALPGIAAPAAAVGGAPAPVDADAEAVQAAFGAARHAEASAPASGVPGADAATLQISLNDPLGAAVELRVSRPAGTGAEAAPWTLAIGSRAADAALLARHAPRLDARLRARAVPLSHVRIEADDEAADSHSG